MVFRSNSTLKDLSDGANGYRQVTSVVVGDEINYYVTGFGSSAIIVFDEGLNIIKTLTLS